LNIHNANFKEFWKYNVIDAYRYNTLLKFLLIYRYFLTAPKRQIFFFSRETLPPSVKRHLLFIPLIFAC